MLRRKFYDVLLNWKKAKKNDCLLVNGARQVGKTWTIRKCLQKEGCDYLELNLYHSDRINYNIKIEK